MKPTFISERRQFLKTLAATTGVALAGPILTGCTPARFQHGVASGDPLINRVIIWTRATPNYPGLVLVQWEVAKDDRFRHPVAHGKTFTDDTVDYTVKVDVEGLHPGRRYYYRFCCNGIYSPVGETRTLPAGFVHEVSLAVFSCSNYPAGYFNVYREAAKRAHELDFVLHLGDYIYEYDKDGYASADAEMLGRVVDPVNELFTLSDYRKRYAQYRSDADLQSAHEKLPFITVWDDHEVANDAWLNGAENHNPGEGDFAVRKAMALQTYYEWMPIREVEIGNKERIFRSFDFGDLLSLHMLDTRLAGRDEQLNYADYVTPGGFNAAQFTADLIDPNRSLLGAEQLAWLTSSLQSSDATWQVLGQQVLMGALMLPAPLIFQQVSLTDYQVIVIKAQTNPGSLTLQELAILSAPSVPLNLDAWDGYPAARETVLQTALALGKNLISLAGDTHNAWASNLNTIGGATAGVEFATPSVSSPGFEEALPGINPDLLAAALVQFAAPLQYANTQHRGFMKLTLTHFETTSEWIFIDTVKTTEYTVLEERSKRLKVLPGAGNLALVEA